MLNSARSFYHRKSPVMGSSLGGPVKEPIYFWIQEQLISYIPRIARNLWIQPPIEHRSEEHTSELQSPCNLVCRLLLEKKQQHKSEIITTDIILYETHECVEERVS